MCYNVFMITFKPDWPPSVEYSLEQIVYRLENISEGIERLCNILDEQTSERNKS